GMTNCVPGKCGAGVTVNDTWNFNGTSWTQLSPATIPTSRYEHGMIYDASIQRIVLFGGEYQNGSTDQLLQDTWWWDGSTWTQLTGIASPAAREEIALAYDAPFSQVIFFGGVDEDSSPFTGTWTYNTAIPTMSGVADQGSGGTYQRGAVSG